LGDADNTLDKKAVDDHLKRLFDQYKTNAKVFSATHIGHISVSIVFLISILGPFLILQVETRDTELAIAQISQSVEQQEQRIDAFRQVAAGLNSVFDAVENTPQPLKAYILSLEAEAAGGPKATYPQEMPAAPDNCGAPDNRKKAWMTCRVQRYLQDRFALNQQILSEQVAAPLEKMKLPESDQWGLDLQTGLLKLQEQFRREISADPTFWMNFGKDSPVYLSMVAGAQHFWDDHQLEKLLQQMTRKAESLRADVDQLNQKKTDIQKRKDELSNSLKGFKTRFGKIGMELSDAILIAPIVFAVLFVLTISNLMGSIRLRKSFHDMLIRFKDSGQVALTDSEIALTMPLWIDPLDPPAKRKLRAFILTIPLTVAILTLMVVIYCLRIPGAFPGFDGVDYWKYFFYYLISAGLFIYACRQIIGAVKGYKTPRAPMAKSEDR
jgi:prefoldin subunit 5